MKLFPLPATGWGLGLFAYLYRNGLGVRSICIPVPHQIENGYIVASASNKLDFSNTLLNNVVPCLY
jgi:hypothetical protein